MEWKVLIKSGEFAGDYGTPEQEIPATGIPGTGLGKLYDHEQQPGLQQS